MATAYYLGPFGADLHASAPDGGVSAVPEGVALGHAATRQTIESAATIATGLAPEAAPVEGVIFGWAEATAPTVTDDLIARVRTSTSFEECQQHLAELRATPAAGILVTLAGEGVTDSVLTDSEGRFHFGRLGLGSYRVATEQSVPGVVAGSAVVLAAAARIQITPKRRTARVMLSMREAFVTVQGKVTDEADNPIAGARVEGIRLEGNDGSIPGAEERSPTIVAAMTDDRGEFALEGIAPMGTVEAALYLLGSTREEMLDLVEVRVQAEGHALDEVDVTRLPLLPESVVRSARRLCDALLAMPEEAGFPRPPTGWAPADADLPDSRGYVLSGVHLVLHMDRDF